MGVSSYLGVSSFMRVLFWMDGGSRVPGGHLIQAEQTAIAVRRRGIEAIVSHGEKQDLNGFDLVHGFGLPPRHLRSCRDHGVPIVMSTIYWSRDYYTGLTPEANWVEQFLHRLRMAFVLSRSAVWGVHVSKCEMLARQVTDFRVRYEMADLLLPNSEAEAEAIRSDLGVTTPHMVVPNGVNTDFVGEMAADSERSGVLYVGRFEPHKNQLGLIKAMAGSDIPVRLVGPLHPDHRDYYEECRRLARQNISIEPAVPYEQLPMLYRQAKVHVLPSWFETIGLVSLEAAVNGCNVVTTRRGYASDYLRDMAWYCDPGQKGSIRNAICAAYHAPFRMDLRQHILNRFTWNHAAEATVRAYNSVVRGSARTEFDRSGN